MRFGATLKGFVAGVLLVAAGLIAYNNRDFWTTPRYEPGPHHLPPTVEKFFIAVAANDYDAVQKQLNLDKSLLSYISPMQGSALHVASRNNSTRMIELLLDNGADMEIAGRWGGTPLHWASFFGARDSVALLIRRGASLENRRNLYRATPLLWAAYGSTLLPNPNPGGDYLGTCQALIDAGAKCDTQNGDGISALQLASPPVAQLLRQHGATEPTAVDSAI